MSNDNQPTTFEEAFERYIEYRTRFERLEIDFDEFQQSSLNYEQELEIQLKELDSQKHRLQQDLFVERTQNEQYRERSEQTIKQHDKHFDQMQEELNACKHLKDKLTHYIRELEQTNDDLERNNRTLLDSLSTFETKLNRALEQNALLENELDEQQQLTETVQRLRDETRELREELDVLHKTNLEKTIHSSETPIVNSVRMKSILSEAAANSGAILRNSDVRKDSLKCDLTLSSLPHDQQNNLSTPKPPILSTTTDLNHIISTSTDPQLIKGNDYYQPLSNSTRLESLKLINEALRRFTALESTLLTQRKQSQITPSIYSTRSRFNSTTISPYSKHTESIVTQTHA
ncbi:unnamed protein product [Rotaria magnacalcarata]|uniref:NUDE domain-containing protein n=1 Tax=Rotaria magnacalcarata TaxID=392030 RepID=A0A816MZZ4_9BILA|nr:unnamed protein product [Rotaria magnacalcarata]CAF2075132.1 unnamed protein product [Rotaria magnacalcarata]CAF3735786.1 unnamed protein product [Rotaria magnacalcarata]CAF3824416.1 unnamed protein product [Rotaria magnacalcarata]